MPSPYSSSWPSMSNSAVNVLVCISAHLEQPKQRKEKLISRLTMVILGAAHLFTAARTSTEIEINGWLFEDRSQYCGIHHIRQGSRTGEVSSGFLSMRDMPGQGGAATDLFHVNVSTRNPCYILDFSTGKNIKLVWTSASGAWLRVWQACNAFDVLEI